MIEGDVRCDGIKESLTPFIILDIHYIFFTPERW